jgi:hypothetical protein
MPIQKPPTKGELDALVGAAMKPQRVLLKKETLPEVTHKAFGTLRAVIDLVLSAKRSVPEARDKVLSDRDLSVEAKERKLFEVEKGARDVIATAIELDRKELEGAIAAIDAEVEKGSRLSDGLEFKVDESKVYESDKAVFRASKAAHSASAATARLLARQSIDRTLDVALQRAGSDPARQAEEVIVAYRGVLEENEGLLVNTMERYGVDRVRREVHEAARMLIEDEVAEKRTARLPDLTRALLPYKGALADGLTFLRAIEGDAASPDFFAPRGGRGVAGHLKELLPEMWE